MAAVTAAVESDDPCAACRGPVDRVLPVPLPDGYECMWSEALCGRALYCQKCYDGTAANDEAPRSGDDDAAEAVHVGDKANAESCPACDVEQRDLPYPWLCPAEPGAAVTLPGAPD